MSQLPQINYHGAAAVLRPVRHCAACGMPVTGGGAVHPADFAARERSCGVYQPREFCFRCSEVIPVAALASFPLLEAA